MPPAGTSPTTIPAVTDHVAERHGDLEALVDGDLRLTFAELAAEVDVVARSFIAVGLQPGEHVAIWAPNSGRWAVAALAVYRAGGVLVTLNTRLKRPEAHDLLARSASALVFIDTDFLGTDEVLDLGEPPACVRGVVSLHGHRHGAMSWADFRARHTTVAGDSARTRAASLTDASQSDLLFTSGTTGRPKGAMLRHGASVRMFTSWADVVGLTAGDRYLIINPFFHTFGLKAGILACLLTGATMLPQPVFDVPAVMRRVAAERITMLPGPPAIYQSMLASPDLDEHDLSSLRLAVTGAATVPVDMVRRMFDTLGFETVVTGYGLTESTGVVTMCRHDDDPDTIATTCGRAIPGLEVRTVDDAGTPTEAGVAGEVVVRGDDLMSGYFEDPEATSVAIDADGWLHTGDVGVLDERGYLRITDRLKDMFIVGGFNVYPAEIEQTLCERVDVAQVAVIGVPDDRLGEVGKAFVVPMPGVALDHEELHTWCRARMANYKVPRSFEIVDSLPHNASNKVLKTELRNRTW